MKMSCVNLNNIGEIKHMVNKMPHKYAVYAITHSIQEGRNAQK